MTKKLKGLLFIVSGPSGVGKGTIIRAIKKEHPNFVYPFSCTTRKKRKNEKEGDVYHFIGKKEFKDGIDKGEFLEWAQVHKGDFYGTLKKPIMDALEKGKIVIREVDVQGFLSIRRVIPSENLVTIFVRAESTEKLLARIAKRGKLPEEELRRRMESVKKEMEISAEFDYEIWNYESRVSEAIINMKDIIYIEAKKAGLKI